MNYTREKAPYFISPYFLFVPSLVPGLADNRQTTNQCMGTYGGVQKPLTSVVGVVWCRSD